MKKDKILNPILGVLYYICVPVFFFYLCIFELFAGQIINFSAALFFIFFLIIPFLFLLLPVIIRYTLDKKFYKSILYSCAVILIHLLLILGLTFGLIKYFSTFSTEKWCNNDWYGFRYLMIDDLKEQHKLVGMEKDEVYSILGEEDSEFENSQGENVICYFVNDGFLAGEYFEIFLDDDDIVTKVDVAHWN